MLTHNQRRQLNQIIGEKNAYNMEPAKMRVCDKAKLRAVCPICWGEMDSFYVKVDLEEKPYIACACINECEWGGVLDE